MAASKSNRPTPTFGGSVFPSDAVARIFRPARSALTSGKARTKSWMLHFDRRTPPVIEPLMGWTGGDDTLTQVELTFPTREAAVAYAERQGLTLVIEGHDSAARAPERRAINSNSQGGVSPKCHRFVEFAFDERSLGDLGRRI